MLVFGESEHQLDDKGRINIPRKFQPMFEQGGFLTRGFTGMSLVFWSHDAWEDVKRRLGVTDFTALAVDDIGRYISCGTEVSLDGQGRLMVPPNLRRRANLEKEVTLLAIGNKLEIWDTATWRAYDDGLTPAAMGQALQQIKADHAVEA
jgi:MraZ protein